MLNIEQIVGAVLLTYVFSRLARRIPAPLKWQYRLVAAHVVSLGAIGLLLFALRQPMGVFALNQITLYLLPQLLWLLLDYQRGDWRVHVPASA